MWIRFDVAQRVFVTAGKQHVRWGTGRFWQPTDYLHLLRRNPLDVFDARQGTSMLKLHMPWEQRGWNFYAFGVFEDPNLATNNLRRLAGAARAEIVIGSAEIGLDAFVKRDQKPRFGIDFSAGVWDFDIYADVGIRYGQDFRTVVELTPDPNQPRCDPNVDDPYLVQIPTDPLSSHYALQTLSGIKTQAVGGINYSRKYNDNDLFLIGAEYFYNQPGIADPNLYPGLLFNTSNTQMLNFFYIGRHYAALFLSLPGPYSWNYTNFTLSTLSNLSDMSFVSRVDYSVTLLTHLTLEAFLGVHYGTRGGEFRAGFDIPRQITNTTVDTPMGPMDMCVVSPGPEHQPDPARPRRRAAHEDLARARAPLSATTAGAASGGRGRGRAWARWPPSWCVVCAPGRPMVPPPRARARSAASRAACAATIAARLSSAFPTGSLLSHAVCTAVGPALPRIRMVMHHAHRRRVSRSMSRR